MNGKEMLNGQQQCPVTQQKEEDSKMQNYHQQNDWKQNEPEERNNGNVDEIFEENNSGMIKQQKTQSVE